ncbi:B3 domain-containing transcription factor VRN1-like isoform X2 [Arachis ipaensis]|uniref:B3 domain-containing transcription factor VRN1-like isoform X2 n=1 Tax=Arachis ipaensis TaxID=130454 RepID=UPI000A2B0B8C|nr:B3 domain-containing transcription factor VRN1-like isoform X2 [Arachis ipaensis]
MSSQERDVVHFFKVILEKNLLDDGFLRLPKSFVHNYWKRITSRSVFLSLPNGAELEVHWSRDERGDVVFGHGWKEFAQYVSLQATQFLLFRYELKKTNNNNNNKFYVIVLGSSGLEIKYPCSNSEKKNENVNVNVVEKGQKGEKKSDGSFEFVNGKRRKSLLSPPQSPPPPPPPLVISDDETNSFKRKSIIKEEPEDYSIDGEINTTKRKRRASRNFDYIAKEKDYEVLDNKTMKKFQEKVKSRFQTGNPFFVCALGKTYSDRDLLVIPSYFAKPILGNKEGNAKLFLVDDPNKCWDVQMRISACRQFIITNGWKKFSTFYSLKLGDACVFELVDPIDILFKVHIRSYGEDPLTPSSPEYSEQEGPSYRPPSSSSSPFPKKHKTSKANFGSMPKNE